MKLPPGWRRDRPDEQMGAPKDGLRRPNVDRLETLGPLLDVELDRLTLLEGAEAIHLDGGVMHEHIVPTARLRDEAEALLGVEPLDCSGSVSYTHLRAHETGR